MKKFTLVVWMEKVRKESKNRDNDPAHQKIQVKQANNKNVFQASQILAEEGRNLVVKVVTVRKTKENEKTVGTGEILERIVNLLLLVASYST